MGGRQIAQENFGLKAAPTPFVQNKKFERAKELRRRL
jgi:hypothetical protein